MNFQAGYILDGISQIIDKQFEYKSFFKDSLDNEAVNRLRGLFENVSSFNITFPDKADIDYLNINPVLAVLNNILTRGLPTRAPVLLEETLESAGLVQRNIKNEFEEKFQLAEFKFSYQDLFEILHLVYPQLDITRDNYAGRLDSDLEWKFLQDEPPVFKQILQPQRFLSTLNPIGSVDKRLDFSYTIPYQTPANVGVDFQGDPIRKPSYKTVIFEIDGPHHLNIEYLIYDNIRDELAKEANAEVIRYPFSKLEMGKDVSKEFDETLFGILQKNYDRNITDNLALYTIVLLPFSVARIQKTLLEIFIRNQELLNKEELKICFIERDIPGSALALKIFEESISNLNALLFEEAKLHLPKITATLLQDEKWLYHESINCEIPSLDWDNFKPDDFDLIIDHSVLIRENIYNFNNSASLNYHTVRSVHFVNMTVAQSRQIYCAAPLKYKPLVIRNEDTSYTPVSELLDPVSYFLRNIFFKKSFREGQLPIISRALQKLPVIGLLPTGGGKSLTFQIPALLQPGLTVIVDPIKSLMEDQVRVLKENWIDVVAYVNSSQKNYIKNQSIADFKLGKKQLIFVSPERFVIENFRDIVNHINSTGFGQNIIYCVIDEVHCLSEWGHDFRSDYLMLGENAQTYCFSRSGSVDKHDTKVGLIGLTATASFDVLADIERELKIKSDEIAQATIMIENTIRPELFFRIVNVSGHADRSVPLMEEMEKFPATFEYYNNPESLLKSQQHHFEKFDPLDFCVRDDNGEPVLNNGTLQFLSKDSFLFRDNLYNQATITFCAVKGVDTNDMGEFKNKMGVRYIHEQLCNNGISAAFYHGSEYELEQKITQRNFNLFTGGNVNNMVCTKAFGMGIDKDNIRATYHINYSGSLESLVQECGRAGRDKKTAVSTIFIQPGDTFSINPILLTKYYHGLNSFHMYVIKQNLMPDDVYFASRETFLEHLDNCDFTFTTKDGKHAALSPFMIKNLREKIRNNADVLITASSPDTKIHEFFYGLAFKGEKFEKAQMARVMNINEFPLADGVQSPLRTVFYDAENGEFDFFISFKHDTKNELKETILNELPFTDETKLNDFIKYINTAKDLEEFWYNLAIKGVLNENELSESQKATIEAPYLASRGENETGKLVYRMNALGLLKSYTKDYNKGFYKCKFYKAPSIDYYIENLSIYLRRYQSEITVEREIERIRESLSHTPEDLFDDIMLLLFHIVEFSMTEIAHKRKMATDEIKEYLETMLEMESSELEKNFYLKEQIYYYFNAKYAKPGYSEGEYDASLLDDYRLYQDEVLNPTAILYKFISDEIIKNGTEQNNYKHLIGSCKKMTYSLTSSDFKKDWLLHLLNAFALYSTNNISYRNEANFVIENGFKKLFSDEIFHKNDYGLVKEIFEEYFKKLSTNIRPDNPSIFDIDLIKNKLLQDLQAQQIDQLLNKYKQELA